MKNSIISIILLALFLSIVTLVSGKNPEAVFDQPSKNCILVLFLLGVIVGSVIYYHKTSITGDKIPRKE